jgi:glycosyltransferase involved in cell wall biosynthesis
MRIGYDAKRAYHNGTGLGHYSRTLLKSLAEFYPDHDYYLFNPKHPNEFELEGECFYEVLPNNLIHRALSSAWRSRWIRKDLQHLRIQLFHGLSHEIPFGIRKSGIPSVVTIHDLIHERHPEQYKAIDVRIYRKKFRYACEFSRRIISISEQTKKDIISFYKIPEEKISVCYQSCNPLFNTTIPADEKERTRLKYGLPAEYFLYVGSIIERKNLLNICKALLLTKNEFSVPLVVIGDGTSYKETVRQFITGNNLQDLVIFLSDTTAAKASPSFQSATDFPAIYQSAIAMIYPSFFEGFGIPVLEALSSGLPVITSNVSSLPEAGGPAAYLVNPAHPEEIAAGMKKIYSDESFRISMIEIGKQHAKKFDRKTTADAVMKVYSSVW